MLTWYKLQEMADPVLDANDAVTGHIISTTIGGKNGEPKQVILLYWMTWENSLSYEIYWKYKIIETELSYSYCFISSISCYFQHYQ